MKRTQAEATNIKATLTPKRRFPEFQDDSGWNLLPLKCACQMQAGKFVQAADIFEKPTDGLFPCYGGNGLRGYTKTFTHSGKYPLIGRQGALCGNVKLADGDFHATEHAVVASARGGINVDWLFHTLELSNLNQYATGQAQPGVSVEVLEKVSIAVPPKESEQQKIAECLSTLDELIGFENQKLDALKAHKKGLMQQLFPREGETLPRLRFQEFQDAPEWEEKEVGEIFNVTRGQVLAMPRVSDKKTQSTPYPVYSSQTKQSGRCGFYSDFLFEDAITWTTDGANAGDVNFRSGKFYCTNVCGVLLSSEGYANPCIAAVINSVARKHVSYVGNPKLMNGVMAKIVIPFPSVAEQQRVASCLSSLDDLIATQSDQIEVLKTHKKGLMQQLFPSQAEAAA